MSSQFKTRWWSWLMLGLILAMAVFLRVNPVLNQPETIRAGYGPFGDTALYHQIAYNLYAGNGFSGVVDGGAYGVAPRPPERYEPAITRGPVYPAFLAAVYTVLGDADAMQSIDTWRVNLDRARLAQCLLDAGLCLIVFLVVRRLVPDSMLPALVAAFLCAGNLYGIYYSQTLLSETVAATLLTGFLAAWILGLERGAGAWHGVAGGLLGLLILTRPEYLLFPLAMVLVNLVLGSGLRRAATGLICAMLVVAPWSIRNYHHFQAVIPVSTGGVGLNLWLGTFETQETWRGWGQYPEDAYRDTDQRARLEAAQQAYDHHLSTGTIAIVGPDQVFREAALDAIRDDPAGVVSVWISRIPQLWYQRAVQRYPKPEPPGLLLTVIIALAGLAFVGADPRSRRLMAPVALVFGYLTVVFLPLHVEPRYGVPLIPGLIALAGVGVNRLVNGARRLSGDR